MRGTEIIYLFIYTQLQCNGNVRTTSTMTTSAQVDQMTKYLLLNK
jgi:hypothetical protein